VSHRGAVVLLAVAMAALPGVGALTAQPYVIGGIDASLAEFPFMVRVYTENESGPSVCGGTLVRADWVLTAAHCLDNGPYDVIYAFVGTNDDYPTTLEEFLAYGGTPVLGNEDTGIFLHPGWTPTDADGLNNDLALLRLREDAIAASVDAGTEFIPSLLALNGATSPLLQGGSYAPTIGDAVTVAGWGRTSTGSNDQADTLQEADLALRSCSPWDETTILCAGTTETGNEETTCGGDSGGPLLRDIDPTAGVQWLQIGVTSFGPINCSHFLDPPGAYTNVAQLIAFVQSVINANAGIATLKVTLSGAAPYPETGFTVATATGLPIAECAFVPGDLLDCTGDVEVVSADRVNLAPGAVVVSAYGQAADLTDIANSAARSLNLVGGRTTTASLALRPLAGDGSPGSGYAVLRLAPAAPYAPRIEAALGLVNAVAEPRGAVIAGDLDIGAPLSAMPGAARATDAGADGLSLGDLTYWDSDDSSSVTVGDLRLGTATASLSGSIVLPGARDLGPVLFPSGHVGFSYYDFNGDAGFDAGETGYLTSSTAAIAELDVRLAPVAGCSRPAGLQVAPTDCDLGRSFEWAPLAPSYADIDASGTVTPGDAAVVDWDASGTITVGDQRLTTSQSGEVAVCLLNGTISCGDGVLALNHPYVAVPAPGSIAATLLGQVEDADSPGDWLDITAPSRRVVALRAGQTLALTPALVPLDAIVKLDTASMPYAVRADFRLLEGTDGVLCELDRLAQATTCGLVGAGLSAGEVTALKYPYVAFDQGTTLLASARAWADLAGTDPIGPESAAMLVRPTVGRTTTFAPRVAIDPADAILKLAVRPSSVDSVTYTVARALDPGTTSSCTVDLAPASAPLASACTGSLDALAGGYMRLSGLAIGDRVNHALDDGAGLEASLPGRSVSLGRVTTVSASLA
jgi:trypsin